jgi:osmotically inducible lipoprotein OsmB
MKKVLSLSLVVFVVVVFLSGCAGMDPRYQSNMAQNAGIWGTVGAVAGAGIAAVTHGNPLTAAVIGGVSGAALGAANTPTPDHPGYQGLDYEETDCSIYAANQGALKACEQGNYERAMAWQKELERDAYNHGRGVRQPVYRTYPGYYPIRVEPVRVIYDWQIIKVKEVRFRDNRGRDDDWRHHKNHRR